MESMENCKRKETRLFRYSMLNIRQILSLRLFILESTKIFVADFGGGCMV